MRFDRATITAPAAGTTDADRHADTAARRCVDRASDIDTAVAATTARALRERLRQRSSPALSHHL